MIGSNKRLARVEAQQTMLAGAVHALAMATAANARGHRKPDLSKRITLDLRPLHELTDTAVRTGIQRLLDKRYFDICGFNALAELARIYVPKDLEKHLRPLHCVDWNDMDPEYRDQIQQHIIACFVPVESSLNAETEETPNA